MRPAHGDKGSVTWQAPSTGAVLAWDDGSLATRCSGVLVGCDTFLTAAHCLCRGALTAAACTPEQPVVLLQHVGLLSADSVTVHPGYDYPVDDLAVIRLSPQATGVGAALVDPGPPPMDMPATVVGFGRSGDAIFDPGLKRLKTVTTEPCPDGYPDDWVCWSFTGEAPRICGGAAGAPLMVDTEFGSILTGLGLGFTRASIARPPPLCIVAGSGLDADLSIHASWLQSQGATSTAGTRCGNISQVGEADTDVTTITGTLGPTRSTNEHAVIVTPNTQLLRVVLNGQDAGPAGAADLDLFVRAHGSSRRQDFCAGTTGGPYAACEFPSPPPGQWDLRVDRVTGSGHYQLTATAFGADGPVCGNGVREVGEDCDGIDRSDCAGGCTANCACVACPDGNLQFDEVQFTRRFFLKGTLDDPDGRYLGLDPRTGGFALTVTDDKAAMVRVVIPPNDAGWSGSRPREGLYRWRGNALGIRRITLQDRTRTLGWWRILIDGQDVLRAYALGFDGLRFTIAAGSHCALKTFP